MKWFKKIITWFDRALHAKQMMEHYDKRIEELIEIIQEQKNELIFLRNQDFRLSFNEQGKVIVVKRSGDEEDACSYVWFNLSEVQQ